MAERVKYSGVHVNVPGRVIFNIGRSVTRSTDYDSPHDHQRDHEIDTNRDEVHSIPTKWLHARSLRGDSTAQGSPAALV